MPKRGCNFVVNGSSYAWKEGKCLLFDDAYLHSVNHKAISDEARVVFMVDLWHPKLESYQLIALKEVLKA